METKGKWILGLSVSDHNGSACLLHDDQIVVAIQEERLTRKKRDCLRRPRPLSIDYCLKYAGISDYDLDLVVGCGIASNKVIISHLKKIFPSTIVKVIPHHLGHAIGAFAISGFYDASILIVDGAGSAENDLPLQELVNVKRPKIPVDLEYREIISLYTGLGTNIQCIEKHLGSWSRSLSFGSIGDLYETTATVIFGQNESGKVMGLAPYGRVSQTSKSFFEVTNNTFHFKQYSFPQKKLWPNNKKLYQNLAASVQSATEEALLYLVRRLKSKTTSNNLIFSGGVALNSVANEKIVQKNIFKNIYFMPASEDSGNCIGAAYYGLWQLKNKNTLQQIKHDEFGIKYSSKEIKQAVEQTPKVKSIYFSDSREIISKTVDLLEAQKIIGLFQGGSELGPRALGQRSIICDPRSTLAKNHINSKVKHRESFRPFAPAILEEEAIKWFQIENKESPFMLRVAQFRDDKLQYVPAVVHCDGTGRIQTLTHNRNGVFYKIVLEFFKRTGVPILLNTSFNVMNEPIVETPEDALWCLLYTDLDYCIFQNIIAYKSEEYQSLLDLYPYLTYSKQSSTFSKNNGELGQYFKSSFAYFLVNNNWGKFYSDIELIYLNIINLIDGNKSGNEILNQIKTNQIKGFENLNEFDFLKILGLLRRKSIINFK